MLRRALETQQKEAEEEATRLKKELDDLKESVIEHKNKLQKEFRHRLQVSYLYRGTSLIRNSPPP